jgi:DNA polymerase-3 subunit gamma/tau
MTLLRMLAFQPASATQQSGASSRGPASQPASRAKPADVPTTTPPGFSAGQSSVTVAGNGLTAGKLEWTEPDWSELVERLDLKGAARLLAGNCAYLRRDGAIIHLGLDRRFESTLSKSRQAALADALTALFGERLRVEIAIGSTESETPMQKKVRLGDEQLEAARASLEADPNVRALRDMFGAELNPDSVEILSARNSGSQEQVP